jgi:hypothetical protein
MTDEHRRSLLPEHGACTAGGRKLCDLPRHGIGIKVGFKHRASGLFRQTPGDAAQAATRARPAMHQHRPHRSGTMHPITI